MAYLKDGRLEMTNNRAERGIKKFVMGRKVWLFSDSVAGAEASEVIYSIVETAKANNLRVHDYVELLLTELSAHAADTNRDFIQDLLPWSKNIQEKCHSLKKS